MADYEKVQKILEDIGGMDYFLDFKRHYWTDQTLCLVKEADLKEFMPSGLARLFLNHRAMPSTQPSPHLPQKSGIVNISGLSNANVAYGESNQIITASPTAATMSTAVSSKAAAAAAAAAASTAAAWDGTGLPPGIAELLTNLNMPIAKQYRTEKRDTIMPQVEDQMSNLSITQFGDTRNPQKVSSQQQQGQVKTTKREPSEVGARNTTHNISGGSIIIQGNQNKVVNSAVFGTSSSIGRLAAAADAEEEEECEPISMEKLEEIVKKFDEKKLELEKVLNPNLHFLGSNTINWSMVTVSLIEQKVLSRNQLDEINEKSRSPYDRWQNLYSFLCQVDCIREFFICVHQSGNKRILEKILQTLEKL